MGRLSLILRLAVRDLRRRPAEAVLLLLAITAATATLTLGLALDGVTRQPYQETRAATSGPDVVVDLMPAGPHPGPDDPRISPAEGLAALTGLTRDPAVAAGSGPYPGTWTVLAAGGRTAGAEIQGRDLAAAQVDQPKVTSGHWLGGAGQAVLERAFADALGVRAGDAITLGNRRFAVAGIAITAAVPAYPMACLDGCDINVTDRQRHQTGLVWTTRADAVGLATPAAPLVYHLNLRLKDPAAVAGYRPETPGDPVAASAFGFLPSTEIAHQDGLIVAEAQQGMEVGAWMLGILATAGVAVLVGGRLADRTRRIGLLKAVGGTPAAVTGVLLAEYLLVAMAAAVAGLALGRLLAPLLTDAGAGLIGSAGAPSVTVTGAVTVIAMALGVAVLAAAVPSLRAVRSSTVGALTDSARPPRRSAVLISCSRRLPTAMMIGLRLAARRPRRSLLSSLSVGFTVATLVVALSAGEGVTDQVGGPGGLTIARNPRVDQLEQVLLVVTVMLIALAVVNAVLITWATALDARRSLAVARAFGATPQQVAFGLSAAQMIPATPGALLGIPAGMGLATALKPGTEPPAFPALWLLLAVAAGTVLVTALLTAIPARIGAGRPVTGALHADSG